MKLIHLSDLHLGKRVNEYSMIEDQEYILKRIINIIDDEKPDGVVIAGDIYDKGIAPIEAITMFDDFIYYLSKRQIEVYIISGNHDSPERLSFGSRIMNLGGIHVSPVYDGNIKPLKFKDEYGNVNIYMLPFVKPGNVRRFYEDQDIATYNEASKVAIDHMDVNTSERNILVTHQFVTGAIRSESEEINVGGSDNVDVTLFNDFDYVALGHLHAPQKIGRDTVRYSGTPLKYSFSESRDQKSVTIVELNEKGKTIVRTANLVPKHDMVELKGTYDELTSKSFYANTTYQEDYTHITLTDEEDIVDAMGKLRSIYHNIMKLDYDNMRTKKSMKIKGANHIKEKSPITLFSEFYELQNNQGLSDEQRTFLEDLIKEVWED